MIKRQNESKNKRVIKFGIMCVRFGWLMLTMLRNPTLVWWSSDTSIVHRLRNWDRSNDISNPNAKYGIYDILFLFRSLKYLMVVFLWAINGHLLRNLTLVWWSNDLLINHTESTIEVCLTVWNWCVRVSDGTRVVPSRSCELRACWITSVDYFKSADFGRVTFVMGLWRS